MKYEGSLILYSWKQVLNSFMFLIAIFTMSRASSTLGFIVCNNIRIGVPSWHNIVKDKTWFNNQREAKKRVKWTKVARFSKIGFNWKKVKTYLVFLNWCKTISGLKIDSKTCIPTSIWKIEDGSKNFLAMSIRRLQVSCKVKIKKGKADSAHRPAWGQWSWLWSCRTCCWHTPGRWCASVAETAGGCHQNLPGPTPEKCVLAS